MRTRPPLENGEIALRRKIQKAGNKKPLWPADNAPLGADINVVSEAQIREIENMPRPTEAELVAAEAALTAKIKERAEKGARPEKKLTPALAKQLMREEIVGRDLIPRLEKELAWARDDVKSHRKMGAMSRPWEKMTASEVRVRELQQYLSGFKQMRDGQLPMNHEGKKPKLRSANEYLDIIERIDEMLSRGTRELREEEAHRIFSTGVFGDLVSQEEMAKMQEDIQEEEPPRSEPRSAGMRRGFDEPLPSGPIKDGVAPKFDKEQDRALEERIDARITAPLNSKLTDLFALEDRGDPMRIGWQKERLDAEAGDLRRAMEAAPGREGGLWTPTVVEAEERILEIAGEYETVAGRSDFSRIQLQTYDQESRKELLDTVVAYAQALEREDAGTDHLAWAAYMEENLEHMRVKSIHEAEQRSLHDAAREQLNKLAPAQKGTPSIWKRIRGWGSAIGLGALAVGGGTAAYEHLANDPQTQPPRSSGLDSTRNPLDAEAAPAPAEIPVQAPLETPEGNDLSRVTHVTVGGEVTYTPLPEPEDPTPITPANPSDRQSTAP